jgi:hypothetical protein
MDSTVAFMMCKMARDAGNKIKVFDWDKAAQIIKERKAADASAGLSMDWEWTGGVIFRDGKPMPKEKTYVYLASLWATPELEIDSEIIDCWKWQEDTPGWGANTYWPASALKILESEGVSNG